jgi:hypothetical protein
MVRPLDGGRGCDWRQLGYAKEVLGGIVLTDDGLRRTAIDRERVLTFVEADASR